MVAEPEFTPEEIAQGEKVTAYYQQDLPKPDDDETKTQPPFPLTSKTEVDDKTSSK